MTTNHFFSHDFSARNDEKLLILRSELGLEGYGLFWCFIECLAEHDGYIKEKSLRAISFSLQADWDLFQRFFDVCIESELLRVEDEKVFSDSLNKRLEYKREVSKKRSEAGKKGAKVKQENNKSQANAKQMLSNSSANTKQNLANETKRNETKQNNTKLNTREAKASTLKKREEDFKKELEPYLSDYGSEMLNKFFLYWTEPNKSKTKMKFEQEKTWDISRRLNNWASREKDFKPRINNLSFRERDDIKAQENLDIVRSVLGHDKFNTINENGDLINAETSYLQ